MNIQYAPPKKTIQYYFIESFMGTSRMKIAKTFTYFSEQHQWKYFQTVFNLIKVKIVSDTQQKFLLAYSEIQ